MYKTILGLCLKPPWEGGWLWYPFCDIYDYLCSNMIFNFMDSMKNILFLLQHDDKVDSRYGYDERITGWGR